MADTKKETKTVVSELAVDAFKDHILTFESDSRTWKCHNQESGYYWFRIAELPGAVLIWGDIGTMTIIGRGYGLEWIAGSVNSPEYLLSKTTKRRDWFYCGEFKQYLTDRVEEAKQESAESGDARSAKRLSEAAKDFVSASYYDFDLVSYNEYMSARMDTDAHDTVYGYDSEAYWLLEALKVFSKLYDQQKTSNSPAKDVARTI